MVGPNPSLTASTLRNSARPAQKNWSCSGVNPGSGAGSKGCMVLFGQDDGAEPRDATSWTPGSWALKRSALAGEHAHDIIRPVITIEQKRSIPAFICVLPSDCCREPQQRRMRARTRMKWACRLGARVRLAQARCGEPGNPCPRLLFAPECILPGSMNGCGWNIQFAGWFAT